MKKLFTKENTFTIELIKYIKKWKLVSSIDIINHFSETISKPRMYRVLRNLTEHHFVKRYMSPSDSREFYYSLGQAALCFIPDTSYIYFNIDHLSHDLKLAAFVQAISRLDNYQSHGFDFDNFPNLGIIPDAHVDLAILGRNIKFAIELEIIQKEKERVIKKLNEYIASTNTFSGVIYAFTDYSTCTAYIRFLDELLLTSHDLATHDNIRKRFSFVLLLSDFLPHDVHLIPCSRNKIPSTLGRILAGEHKEQTSKMHRDLHSKIETKGATIHE